jgi:hypothetical protein
LILERLTLWIMTKNQTIINKTHANWYILIRSIFYEAVLLFKQFKYPKISTSNLKRIRSCPGNNILPVNNSAIIHPTDHISTEILFYV